MTDIFKDKSLNTFPTDTYGFSQCNQAEMLIEIFKVIGAIGLIRIMKQIEFKFLWIKSY